MAMKEKRVLEGTKEDFAAHVMDKMRQEAELATDDAKGTARDKHGHDCAAKDLEWVLGEMEAWVETPADDGEAGPGSAAGNGSVEAQRREAAADAV